MFNIFKFQIKQIKITQINSILNFTSMKYSLTVIVFLFCFLLSYNALCQNKVVVKTNLLYGVATLTPNLGVEVGLGGRTTFNLSGSYNWFNLYDSRNNNKKLVHWIVQPEFRYYLCQRFNGHFFGLNGLYSNYNIGGYELPFLFGDGSKDFRYQGNGYGFGISYGYQLVLTKRWNLEFDIGVGYMQMKYNRVDGEYCGRGKGINETKNYFGPTKAGISLVFML